MTEAQAHRTEQQTAPLPAPQGTDACDPGDREGGAAHPDATTTQLGQARQRVRNAAIAVGAPAANTQATLLGMLNLERLEMAPAGLQRGELIATIPLAPLEETA